MIQKTLPISFAGSTNAKLTLYCVTGDKEMGFEDPRPCVLVIPGGGYSFVSTREAEPVALRFVSQGYNAAVLTYSVKGPRFPQQLGEAAAAMALLREHAAEWYIDPHRIATCGFSAGGHLALSLGVHWNKPWLYEALNTKPETIRPDAQILIYPVVTNNVEHYHSGSFRNLLGEDPTAEELEITCLDRQIYPEVPPTFLWHTIADKSVPWKGSLMLTEALWENGVPCEIHFPGWGPHGVALADEVTARKNTPEKPNRYENDLNPHLAHWVELSQEWLNHTLA